MDYSRAIQMFPQCFPRNPQALNISAKLLKRWCPHTDSNRGPTDYKSVALPAEL